MTAPVKQDAAIRYTENGQSKLHYLGATLRRPVVNPVQNIYEHRPANPTGTVRRVTVGDTAYDLRAGARFEGDRQSLIDFVAAARRGASIEYFKSLSNPSLSFPCDLVNAAEIRPDSDLWWQSRDQTEFVLRRSDGGTWQALLEEPLFYWRAGNAAPGTVFTRAGAVGPYSDSDTLLKELAANLWRTEWTYENGGLLPDTPWLLLESPAFTNLVDEDDLTQWTVVGTPVVTGSVSDPAGGTGAFTVEDNAGGATEYILRPVTGFANGTANVVAIDVRENTMPASGVQAIRVSDTTSPATRLRLAISAWSGGEPAVAASTGTFLGQRYVGNGYWRLYGLTTAITEAETNQIWVTPADTASEQGSIDVCRVNAFAALSPPWSILDASETKAAETYYADWLHRPQAKSGMVDFRDLENPTWSDTLRIIQIGDASDSDPRLRIYRPAGGNDVYRIAHHVGGSSVTSTIDINPQWGDRIQLFWWLFADGSVQIAGRRQALGSSTWSSVTTGTQSGALSLAGAWSGERIYFGSAGATGRGSQLFHKAIVFPGSAKTTAELLAA